MHRKLDYIAWDDKVASGVALIMVDETGENAIAVAPGANGCLSPDDVAAAEAAIAEADVVLLQFGDPFGDSAGHSSVGPSPRRWRAPERGTK